MAETYKVNVEFVFEVEKSGTITDEASAVKFVAESSKELVAYFSNLVNDPTYVGPTLTFVGQVPNSAEIDTDE